MIPKNRMPTHPGEILSLEFLVTFPPKTRALALRVSCY